MLRMRIFGAECREHRTIRHSNNCLLQVAALGGSKIVTRALSHRGATPEIGHECDVASSLSLKVVDLEKRRRRTEIVHAHLVILSSIIVTLTLSLRASHAVQ
jgi:hypothetical protein